MADIIFSARDTLTRRYGITADEAEAVLGRVAARNGSSPYEIANYRSEPVDLRPKADALRRQHPTEAVSPAAALRHMSALDVLEVLSVPVVAAAPDGAILFANPAFAALLGYPFDMVTTLSLDDILRGSGRAGVVELTHHDGSTMRARKSDTAFTRHGDTVVLTVFQDVRAR